MKEFLARNTSWININEIKTLQQKIIIANALYFNASDHAPCSKLLIA